MRGGGRAAAAAALCALAADPSASHCVTIPASYDYPGSYVCCPDGQGKQGDGSACSGGGQDLCRLYGNVGMQFCSEANGYNGSYLVPSNCLEMPAGNAMEGEIVCCPEGQTQYGDGSACQACNEESPPCDKPACKFYGNAAMPLCSTVPIDPYKIHTNIDCTDRNELLEAASGYTLESCRTECDQNDMCLSFEVEDGTSKCHLSNTCTEALSVASPDWTLYVKQYQYQTLNNAACTGRNDILDASGYTWDECQAECAKNVSCISFQREVGTDKCQVSATCTQALSVTSNGWTLHIKGQPTTTKAPTKAPTKVPTKPPTKAPTKAPTKPPTVNPTTLAESIIVKSDSVSVNLPSGISGACDIWVVIRDDESSYSTTGYQANKMRYVYTFNATSGCGTAAMGSVGDRVTVPGIDTLVEGTYDIAYYIASNWVTPLHRTSAVLTKGRFSVRLFGDTLPPVIVTDLDQVPWLTTPAPVTVLTQIPSNFLNLTLFPLGTNQTVQAVNETELNETDTPPEIEVHCDTGPCDVFVFQFFCPGVSESMSGGLFAAMRSNEWCRRFAHAAPKFTVQGYTPMYGMHAFRKQLGTGETSQIDITSAMHWTIIGIMEGVVDDHDWCIVPSGNSSSEECSAPPVEEEQVNS